MKIKKLLKNRIFIIVVSVIAVVAIALILYLMFKPCQHHWIDATCENPVTCSLCGDVAGNATGHTWTDATCTDPKTCSVCGKTDGESLGHTWTDATCTDPKTCSVCQTTEGNASGHKWKSATYSKPKTCSVCGATTGSALTQSDSNINNSSDNERKCLLCSNSVSRKETLYCSAHDCMYTNCSYPAKCRRGCEWGSLCEFHSCRYGDCLSIPPVNGYYCDAHDD